MRTRAIKDKGLTSRTNFPGEIQQKTPVRPRISVQQRDAEIAKRLTKITGGRKK